MTVTPARADGEWGYWGAGSVGIIAGGLVAATTDPLGIQHGSWLAAYLVLVCGVAQIALGAGWSRLTGTSPSVRSAVLAGIVFNLGNAGVIIGTLTGYPIILDIGGGLLVVVLAALLWTVRTSARRPRWPLWLYRVLILILLVSIPTGLLIARLKS